MSNILQRVQGIFKRNNKPKRKLPAGSFPNAPPNRQQPLGTITKPPDPTDEDDDDAASLNNYNVPEQTQARGQPRDTIQSGNTSSNLPPNPLNPTTVPNRGAPPATIPTRGAPPAAVPTRGMPSATVPTRGAPPATVPTRDAPPAMVPTRGAPPATVPTRDAPPAMVPTRGVPNASTPNLRNNTNPSNNMNPPPDTNTAPTRNAQPRSSGLPPLPQIPEPSSQPARNLNSTPTNNSQPSRNSSPPDRNVNQTTSPPLRITNQQQSSTQNQLTNNSNNFTNTQQRPSTKPLSTFQNKSNDDDNVSRIELDYPIEDVLIDANIPSAIAIKINDAVEQDRFGNTHHVHRYTFESPSSQRVSFNNNNNNNMDQHSIKSPHHTGSRHIREIHNNDQNPLYHDMNHHHHHHRSHRHHNYSETSLDQYIDQLLHTPGRTVIHSDGFNDLQRILNQHLPNNQTISAQSLMNPFQSNNNLFPEPIVYLTARALPNDPMRNY